MKRRAVFALGIGAGVVLVVACSFDPAADPPANNAGSCAILASQCHPYSEKSALGLECHELGHAGDDGKCGPRLKECQAACPEIEGGGLPFQIVDGAVVPPPPTADASNDAPVATADAGPDGCTSYCECFAATCNAKYTSIYSSMEQCIVSCKSFTNDERTCVAKACDDAKALSEADRNHECDHASGAAECH